MQAETELISRTLRGGRMHTVLAAGIEPHHFITYSPEWEYMLEWWNRYSEVPPVRMFKEKFPDFPYRKSKGSVDVRPVIEGVVENYLETKMALLAQQFVGDLNGQQKPQVVLEKMQGQLDALLREQAGEEQVDIIGDIMTDVEEFKRLQRAEVDPDTHAAVPSPWYPLNEHWGGLRGGEVICVLARSGAGKSWIGLNMATFAAMKGFRPFFAPLEMRRYDVAMRMHSIASYHMLRDKNPEKFKLPQVMDIKKLDDMFNGEALWRNTDLTIGRNTIDAAEYKSWAKMLKRITPKGFVIPDMNSLSGSFHFATFARYVEKSECDIAFLDYLTLLGDTELDKRASKWEIWQEVTRKIKQLAMRLDIPIIVMIQSNRNGAYSKTPQLEDIAYADSIAHNADRVLSLRGKGVDLTVTCIKSRIGADGFKFHIQFYPDYGILEWDKDAGIESIHDDEDDE